ncbi:hypothetical protein JK203_07070 [Gluconobacter cerinus]|uniref:Uncharacterized protein n=1 Tax=Gluconobacter cerinus TaxID=38307 RepID=A0AAV5NGQ8_9PROT|nr:MULTISPECIES: hypothetical protein [Gluconobacter]MBS0983082.1 hypothetical protein [Gluconobacter cerinus]MBS1018270.1 hypothetical protein [Gluconobacter cerinus]MBS1030686.1 hypothetical protein [Gluconobacter cerinus]MBS1033349.1 hypothetical protein [Gluconobacter cerinus]MBS1040608.1 hypothetical protein [Gluconobacter cerinus]
MTNRIFFRSLLAVSLLTGSVSVASSAYAADPAAATQSTQNDFLGNLSQKEDNLNNRVKNYQTQSAASQAERTQKIQALKSQYTNAPANEKANIQNKINNERDKLNTARTAQTEKVQKLRNAPQEQKNRLNALGKKSRSDATNFLNGGL